MNWITANVGTIVVGFILLAIVGLVIFYLVRQKQKGISQCGGCNGCPRAAMGCRGMEEDQCYIHPEK